MTANVTVQTAMNENVLRVPNAALRFSPTPELFASLGQAVPGSGGAGANGAMRATGASAVPESTGTSGPDTGTGRLQQITPEERAQFRARRQAAAEGGSANGAGGRVWVLRNGKLELVRVRTGVSDGAATAVVAGELKEGDQVVTGVSAAGATPAQTSTSPLIPFGRRGGAAGGARGGAGR